MTRISALILTRYHDDGASSRVRALQYLPACNQEDVEFSVAPLLPKNYIADLYSNAPKNYLAIARSYLDRFFLLLKLNQYDVVWIEKELWPYIPAWLEKLFYKSKPRIILDYDDAVFLNYRNHRSILVRWLLQKKIERIIRFADVVTVGNAYLNNFAVHCGACDVRLIPSVVDIDNYHVKTSESGPIFKIGWIGSPATGSYLHSIATVLQKLARSHEISLSVIGLSHINIPGVEVSMIAWSQQNEAKQLQNFDLGIMPLASTEWEEGKCGYKLIQYMACGLPVVASRTGANEDIVSHGKDGFLVTTEQEWITAMTQIIENKNLYKSMSLQAREKIEKTYSLQSQRDNFLSLFLT